MQGSPGLTDTRKHLAFKQGCQMGMLVRWRPLPANFLDRGTLQTGKPYRAAVRVFTVMLAAPQRSNISRFCSRF